MALDTPLSREALSALGLQRDPFSDQSELRFVFADAAHKTQLNVALQLLQASDRLLIVRGEPGIGKTAFLHCLAHRRTPGLRFSRIRGEPALGFEELLGRFLSEAGLVHRDESLSLPLAAARLADAGRAGERPVLLLDDAAALDDDTLSRLLSLRADTLGEGAPFGLVLAAPSDFDSRLDALKDGAGPLHVINLYPYSEKQSVDYLTQRLALAGDTSNANLSEAQKRELHQRAGGVPARLNEAAARLLAERAAKLSPPTTATPARAKRWPSAYIVVPAAVLLLVGGLLAALLILPEPRSTAVSSEPYSLPLPQRYDFEPTTGSQTVSAPSQPGREQAAFLITDDATDEPLPLAEIAAPKAPSEADKAAPIELTKAPSQRPVATESSLEAASLPALAAADPAADSAPAQTHLASATPESAPGSTRDQASSTPVPTSPAPDPASTSSAAASSAAESTKPASTPRDWLAERNPRHYTIQLIGAHDRAALAGYLSRHGMDDEAQLISTRRDGRDWFVAVIGDHSNLSSARAAIQSLPAALRESGPFPRRFESLQSR